MFFAPKSASSRRRLQFVNTPCVLDGRTAKNINSPARCSNVRYDQARGATFYQWPHRPWPWWRWCVGRGRQDRRQHWNSFSWDTPTNQGLSLVILISPQGWKSRIKIKSKIKKVGARTCAPFPTSLTRPCGHLLPIRCGEGIAARSEKSLRS